MTQFRLSVEVQGLGEARLLSEELAGLLAPPPLATTLFEEPGAAGWRFDAYFANRPAEDDLALALTGLLGRLAAFRLEPVPDENWVAVSQAALPPVVAGSFIVHGSHDRARVGARRNAIEIDAGEAFGTAHHATTLGCLLAIDRLAASLRARQILDLGTGSGVLAIAAALTWPTAGVTASDADPVAVAVARENIRRNRLGWRIRTVNAAGLAHGTLRRRGPFDLVIANILAGPLLRLAPAVRRATARRGTVVLSGILVEQAAQVTAAYCAHGFRLKRRQLLSGWAVLTLERRA